MVYGVQTDVWGVQAFGTVQQQLISGGIVLAHVLLLVRSYVKAPPAKAKPQ